MGCGTADEGSSDDVSEDLAASSSIFGINSRMRKGLDTTSS